MSDPSESDLKIAESIRGLMATCSFLQAHTAALEAAVLRISQSCEVSQIDSVPVPRWIRARLVHELQEGLILLENDDPAMAAMIQERIDNALSEALED